MKIEKVRYLRPNAIEIKFSNGKGISLHGDMAKTFAIMYTMQVGERYKVFHVERNRYAYGTVAEITDDFIRFEYEEDSDDYIPTEMDFSTITYLHYWFTRLRAEG